MWTGIDILQVIDLLFFKIHFKDIKTKRAWKDSNSQPPDP